VISNKARKVSPVTICSPKEKKKKTDTWGFEKYIAHGEKVQNVNGLRDGNVRAADSVTNEMLANTWRETEYRLDVCRDANGAHTETY
jgi:hypothetical protein